jgi:hypothetical protein
MAILTSQLDCLLMEEDGLTEVKCDMTLTYDFDSDYRLGREEMMADARRIAMKR